MTGHIMDFPVTSDDGKKRVLIRDAKSGMYFRCPGEWVQSRSEAEDFGTVVQGITFAVNSGWRGVEVVVAVEGEASECRMWKSA